MKKRKRTEITSLKELTKKTTGLKSLQLICRGALPINKNLSRAEAFSAIFINLPNQKLDIIKLNNLNKGL